MYKMELPIGFLSDDFEKAKAYCEHFNCTIHKAKHVGAAHNVVESEDALNFFWLGCNVHLRSTSNLTITPAEKYLL